MSYVTATDVTGQSAMGDLDKQTNTIEDASTGAKEATAKPEEALSPKFAALARQQKILRQQQKAFEEEKKAIEAQKKEIEQARSWKQRLTQDPYGIMLESGLTADQVATLMLNQPNPADQRVLLLEQEIKALKASQEQSSNKFDEVQKQQYEDAKKQIRNDVLMTVDSNESFETIKAMSAHDAVVDLIEQTYKTEGKLMTVEDAATEVENYLLEEAMKMAQLKKIQSKLNPPQVQPEAQKQSLQQTQKQQPINTLTNRMVQSATKPLSDRERRERAVLAFQGKLS